VNTSTTFVHVCAFASALYYSEPESVQSASASGLEHFTRTTTVVVELAPLRLAGHRDY